MTPCAACGFENDETRNFCQNCGARIEREADAPAAQVSSFPAPARRSSASAPKKRSGPLAASLVFVRELVWTAILASILACFIQALRPPDSIPAPVEANPTQASLLASDLQAAVGSDYPRSIDISTEAANNFITTRVVGAGSSDGIFRARFQRAYVIPGTGGFCLGVEQRINNHPVYLQLFVKTRPEGRGTAADIISGSFGRVPVPGFLIPFFTRSFEPVIASLETPLRWLSKASAVDITPAGATARWVGQAPGQ
jgi:hypothetical protein